LGLEKLGNTTYNEGKSHQINVTKINRRKFKSTTNAESPPPVQSDINRDTAMALDVSTLDDKNEDLCFNGNPSSLFCGPILIFSCFVMMLY
jgi:hypothetical protein